MNRKVLLTLCINLIITLLFSGSVFGQLSLTALSTNEVDSVLLKSIKAIPINEVPAKIELVEEDIKMGEKKILPKRAIIQIDSLLPLYVEFIKIQKKSAIQFIKANPNRQKIDNLISKWEGYYVQLDSWQDVVNNQEDKNLDIIIPFKEKELRWQLTKDLAKEENAPPSVKNNIHRTLKEITRIKESIIKENNNLLTLETDITNQKGVVNSIIDEFNHLISSDIYKINHKRHKSIWEVDFSDKNNSEKSVSTGIETIPNTFNSVKKFATENIRDIISYLILLIVLSAFFIIFKKAFSKVKFTEPDAPLQRAKGIIVDHSVSGIIFISTMSGLFFFKSLPFVLKDILLIISLISSIPILRSVMYNRFQNVLYFVILFYIFNSLKTYVWFASSSYRIYTLIESIIALFVIYYFSKPFLETRKMKTGSFGKLLINLVPLLYVLLFIAIGSNLLGYTNLTDLSLKVATQSSILTMIFYCVLMILSGLVLGGLHMILSRQKNFNPERKLLIEKRTIQGLRIVVFLWWLSYFLKLVDLETPFYEWWEEFMIRSYGFGSVHFSIGEILSFIIVLSGSFLLSSLVSMIVDGGALKVLKLPKGIPAAISVVLRYFIIAFGFVLALSALGINLSNFNLMAGALGLGIGFGLQTIISNFVSGLILVFERPILPGDTVEVQNLLGEVTNIGVRSSKVRTFDGAEVIVPNNNLISNDLINWTLSDNIKRIEIKIGAAYGTDPNVVLKLLKEEALKNEFTLKDPEPVALFDQFGNSSLDFRLLAWVPYTKGIISKSIISVGVYNSFKENGISIPFPQQDLYIKEVADKVDIKPKTVKKPPKEDKNIDPLE